MGKGGKNDRTPGWTFPEKFNQTFKRQARLCLSDLDVLDPGILPGVGTPEPGGLTFREFLSPPKALQPLRVVGFDIVELTPDYDPTQISSVTASVILREMIRTFVHPSRK